MRTLQLIVLSGLCVGMLAACSSSDSGTTTLPTAGTSGDNGGSSGETATGGTNNGGNATTGGSSGEATGGSSGEATGGSSGEATGGSSGEATGGSSGEATGGSSGEAAGGATGQPVGTSTGCGMALPAIVTGTGWIKVADPKGATAIQVNGEPRGYYVQFSEGAANYNPNTPHRVVYEGAGCGDTSAANGATSGYAYQNYDTADTVPTIQVGIDYGTVRTDHCYDNENPNSNDFAFFPILHQQIESMFCVDLHKQFFSGYSTGAWEGMQFTCAFPDVLRGIVVSTGNEPMMQPTCVSGHPEAGLFLHDLGDAYNTYQGILPGCTRLLQQNGCTTTTCDPSNTGTSTPYTINTTLPNSVPQSLSCVQFNGCPVDSPVVFCTTTLNGSNNDKHYIGADAWVTPLFWDFLNRF